MDRPPVAEPASSSPVTAVSGATDSAGTAPADDAAAPPPAARASHIHGAEPDTPSARSLPPVIEPPYGDPYDDAPTRRPRRNPARYWTMAAVAFALLAAGLTGALWYFGPPGWAVNLGLVAQRDEPQLLFSLPRPPERRKLPTGEEFFAFSGRIINGSDRELTVPPIVVELRDEQGRLVFSWMTKADKQRLAPNQEARISESRLDIPPNARNLSLKFVDSGG